MKSWILLLALVMGCSSTKNSSNGSGLAESVDLDVVEYRLDNGLTALILNNPKLPIFSLKMFYKVGGKNEVPGITGASHFLEHMMFKGAKKYGKNTIDFIIEGSGGSTNAYTTNDQTVYYENLPKDQLEIILDIEADRMENLLLDPDEFERERAVVLEERKMRYENSPRGQLYLELMQTVFKGTPYGQSVIGSIPDLKSVTRDQIYNYFKKFYAPNNAVLVLVGDVNISQAKKIIKQKFGNIPASPSVEEAHKALKDEDFVPKLTTHQVVARKGESPNPIFMLAFPTMKAGHPKGYPLDVVASILGSGRSSSLLRQYTYIEKPVATSMYAAHQQFEKAGMFFIGGELVKGVKINQFRKDLLARLKSFCETEITERNIQKVKNNYLTDLYTGLDTNSNLASFIGDRQAIYGDWKYYKKELGLYEKVDVAGAQEACKEVFSTPSVFVSVWKNHK